MKSILLVNSRNNIRINASVANNFYTKFRGLMFRKEIREDIGLILSERNESVLNTSIHMLFMRFDITAVWMDRNYFIVDKCLAKKWSLAYVSKVPAMHVLELNSSQYENFFVGDKLEIETN